MPANEAGAAASGEAVVRRFPGRDPTGSWSPRAPGRVADPADRWPLPPRSADPSPSRRVESIHAWLLRPGPGLRLARGARPGRDRRRDRLARPHAPRRADALA